MLINDRDSLQRFLGTWKEAFNRGSAPITAHIDVTYRCDLDCTHCYLDNKNDWPEMTTAEIKSLLDQLRHAGVMFLTWSGGEVFARPDFGELLAYASDLRFISRVKTHAGNLTPERVALLANPLVRRIDVSVYSLDDEIHDAVTQVPGSLQATLRGIDMLLEAGVWVHIGFSIFKANLYEIEDFLDYFWAKGCPVNPETVVFPTHSGGSSLDSGLLDYDALVEARRALLRHNIKRRGQNKPAQPSMDTKSDPCGAGRSLAYITPDGAVWPCVAFPMPLGHLREKPFAEIWNTSEARKELVSFTNEQRTDCHSCAGSGSCFYCSGEAFKRTGDFRKAPPNFHWRTRAMMQAWTLETDMPYTPEQFATVPDPTEHLPQPRKRNFVFPIYAPKKGRSGRVQTVAAES